MNVRREVLRAVLLRTSTIVIILLAATLLGSAVDAAEDLAIFSTAHEALAAVDDSSDRSFLLYLHGGILELGDRRATHPERGIYEYDRILEALASTGLVVVSEHRSQTDRSEYADRVVAEVRLLLEAGVPAERITVVGFSKGAGIALLVCDRLARDDVSFVFMGICGPWLEEVPLSLRGRILSIYEKSDSIGGSCVDVVERSPTEPSRFEEIATDVGGGHGAFWFPQDAWLRPVLDWAAAVSEIR